MLPSWIGFLHTHNFEENASLTHPLTYFALNSIPSIDWFFSKSYPFRIFLLRMHNSPARSVQRWCNDSPRKIMNKYCSKTSQVPVLEGERYYYAPEIAFIYLGGNGKYVKKGTSLIRHVMVVMKGDL